MEWVETTGKTLEEAKEQALDQLGVADDEAEYEVLEEPRSGLFGRLRGEARVRARVRPTEVRSKQDRRGRGRAANKDSAARAGGGAAEPATDAPEQTARPERSRPERARAKPRSRPKPEQTKSREATTDVGEEQPVTSSDNSREDSGSDESTVTPEEVGAAAVAFMDGLVEALGSTATTTLDVDGTDLEVRVDGADLGLLIGPGGRTLMAVQDLVRVASQRRLGDHDTRLRIDIAGYRVRRREALEKFARTVAQQVIESGSPKALEPMPSADRKVVHDAIVEIEGVTSHSEGDDPARRVVITPAD